MKLLSEAGLARINRAVISGRIVPYIVVVMFLIMAATTVTTIGYGDVVPATGGGRVIAVFVMFASVATVSLTTAIVTASFVAYQQRRLGPDTARHEELIATLARIEARLDALER
jgi:voltage-gated potassium channel Kch